MQRRFLATIPLILIMLIALGYAADPPKVVRHHEAVHATCSAFNISSTTFMTDCGVAFIPQITGRAHITIDVLVTNPVVLAAGLASVVIFKSTSGIPPAGSSIPPGDTIESGFASTVTLPGATINNPSVATLPSEALDTSLTVGTTFFFYIALEQSGGLTFTATGEITAIEP